MKRKTHYTLYIYNYRQDVGVLAYNPTNSNSINEQYILRKPLEKDMVITVEPGLYFNKTSLAMWTSVPSLSKYFNIERIEQYLPVGGVRIEDTVLITEIGIDNLTIAPKTVKDIEAVMAMGD